MLRQMSRAYTYAQVYLNVRHGNSNAMTVNMASGMFSDAVRHEDLRETLYALVALLWDQHAPRCWPLRSQLIAACLRQRHKLENSGVLPFVAHYFHGFRMEWERYLSWH